MTFVYANSYCYEIPSLAFFRLSFFCLSQLSLRLTLRTDVPLKRTVDSPYYFSSLKFFIFDRGKIDCLAVYVRC